jgi:hypothetical protein
LIAAIQERNNKQRSTTFYYLHGQLAKAVLHYFIEGKSKGAEYYFINEEVVFAQGDNFPVEEIKRILSDSKLTSLRANETFQQNLKN